MGAVGKKEFKEMKIADSAILERITFDTFATFKQIKAKESGKWLTLIKLGKEQDNTIMICGRKDDGGTTMLTDMKQYWKVEDRTKLEVTKI